DGARPRTPSRPPAVGRAARGRPRPPDQRRAGRRGDGAGRGRRRGRRRRQRQDGHD
ncbi:MAG: hypothetical protein AVDCRST_MAG16-118, partial [uncultured Frankineae bacterium]